MAIIYNDISISSIQLNDLSALFGSGACPAMTDIEILFNVRRVCTEALSMDLIDPVHKGSFYCYLIKVNDLAP